MTNPEPERDPVDDARVERILTRFFAHEMPPELQQSTVPAQPASPNADAGTRPSKALSWGPPSVAALAVLLVAGALWLSTSRAPHAVDEGAPRDSVQFDLVESPLPDGGSTTPVAYSLSESVQPVESLRYDTLRGPVEQRTNLNTTNVSFIEPDTGDLLELTLPELVIEIFPIDDDVPPAAAPNPPDGAPVLPDVKLPDVKLPEEG